MIAIATAAMQPAALSLPQMIDWLNANVLWGPPMLVLLLGVGIFLTVRMRFIQFAKFGLMSRETMAKIFRRGPKAPGDVTPFQAMTVAMGGTVGVGNIAGVATAIAAGGPGALFWLLVSGLVGMATKFAEVTLGVHYRTRRPGEPMIGGPMMYISRGLGPAWRPLAVVFCLFAALAGLGIGNMTQAQAVTNGVVRIIRGDSASAQPATAPAALTTAPTTPPTAPTAAPPKHTDPIRWVTGVALLLAVGLVTLGGIKRIAHVAMVCVPFMCTLYMLAAFVVIVLYAGKIPGVLATVVRDAFTGTAAVGGFAGSAVMLAVRKGISRGIFSNEAGLGSAPMAHATATTDHPARQGLWGIFEVFFDTIVMCTATALVILLTGAWTSGKDEAELTMAAFAEPFGRTVADPLVLFCMVLTAYDTILAWCFYGETCMSFVFGHGRLVRVAYRLFWLPFILVGALWELKPIWAVADVLNALMAIPNLIALVLLSGVVLKLTKGFLAKEPYAPVEDRAPD